MRTLGSVILWILTAITGVFALLFIVAFIVDGTDRMDGAAWAWFFGFLIAAPLLGVAASKLWVPRSSRPCPRCGIGVKKGVVVCPTCGFDFSVLVPGPSAPPGQRPQ